MTRLIASTCHAVVLPFCVSFMFIPDFWRSPFVYSTPTSRVITLISAGHFAWDVCCAIRDLPEEGWAFVGHGFSALGLYTAAALSEGAWNFWAQGYYLWEMSTPFVHSRFALVNLNLKKSVYFTVCSYAVFLSFFFARILWGGYLTAFFWWATNQSLTGKLSNPAPVWFVWYARGANVFMNGLNVWWFSKMVRYLVKTLRSGGVTKVDDAEDKGHHTKKKN